MPAPVVSAFTIYSDGTSGLIAFTDYAPPILPTSNPLGFTVDVNGTPVFLSSVTYSAVYGGYTFFLPTVYTGDVVKLSYTPGNVTDSTSSPLAAFGPLTGTNESTQPAPPPSITASLVDGNGTTIILTFNSGGNVLPMLPATGGVGFTVDVNASPITITSVLGGSGAPGDSTMTLYVTPAIVYADIVTLSYAPGNVTNSRPVALEAFGPSDVLNDSNIGRPPTYSSGVVDSAGTQVTVNFTCYDAPMLPSSAATGFTLKANGVTQTISSTSNSGAALLLNLLIPIGEGQTVTLSYTPGNVTDSYPADLAAFGPVTITNESTHPGPPTFASGYINTAGTALIATFNIAAGQSPMLPSSGMTGFTVKANGVTQTISSTSALSGDTVTLNLSAAIPYTDTVTLTYAPGNVTDSYPTDLAAFSATAITNNSNVGKPPTFSSANVDTTGLILTVDFTCYDAPMLPSSAATGFTVEVAGSPATISSTSNSGTTLILNLASAVLQLQAVTIAYTPGNVTDSFPADLAAFSAQSVTNNSTVPVPIASVDQVFYEYLATPAHKAVVDQVFVEYLATLKHVASVDQVFIEYLATPKITAAVDQVFIEYLATPPTPMTITITSPLNGATVNGIVVIQALVQGGYIDVASVSLYINGSLISTQLGVGDGYYTFNWNSTATADGTYTITVQGVDGAGNIVYSSPISVTTDNGEGPTTCYLYSTQQTAPGNIALALLTCNLVPATSEIDSYVINVGFNVPGTSTDFLDGSWQNVNLNQQFIPTVQGDTYAYCFQLARALNLDAALFTNDIVSMIADPLGTTSAPSILILDSTDKIWTYNNIADPVLLFDASTILLAGESVTSFAALGEKVYIGLATITPTTRLYVYDRTPGNFSYPIVPFTDPIKALATSPTLLYIGTEGGNLYSFDDTNMRLISPTNLPHAVTGMASAQTDVSNTVPGIAVFLSDGSAWDINSANPTYGANQTFAPASGASTLYDAINQTDSGQTALSRYICSGSAGNIYVALPGQAYTLDTTTGFAVYAMAPFAQTEWAGGDDGKLWAKNQNPLPDTLAWGAVSNQIGNLTSINSLIVLGTVLVIGGSAESGDTLWTASLANLTESTVTARYIRDVACMLTQTG